MATLTKLAQRREMELQHAFKLARIFPKVTWDPNDSSTISPKSLMFQLAALEHKAHKLAEAECNGEISEDAAKGAEASILARLDALLGFKALGVPVFMNGDPRGYALKIDAEYVRGHKLDIYTDWGGYGILRPDFKEG